MLEGDEPEIQAMLDETQHKNPDMYWSSDQTSHFDGIDLALGIANWRMDGHVDTVDGYDRRKPKPDAD